MLLHMIADGILGTGQEATFALKTNDPSGFNLIDVFAWYGLPLAALSVEVEGDRTQPGS